MLPPFKLKPRPKPVPIEKIPKPQQVSRFTPRKKVSYSALERTFRTWNRNASSADLDKLWLAFDFMRVKHKDQLRKSKTERYEVHPYNVAYYMAQAGGTVDEVVAALVHDTLEDCDTTLDEIQTNFGEKVAQIVNLLSTPKIRPLAKGASQRHELFNSEGRPEKLPLVFPSDPEYRENHFRDAVDHLLEKEQAGGQMLLPSHIDAYHQELDEIKEQEKLLKKNNRSFLVAVQRGRLFPEHKPITSLNWSAIWIKQFDALHNLQTIHGMENEEDRLEFVNKSLDMALFLSDRLSPVISRSIPKEAKIALEKLKEKGGDVAARIRQLLPSPTPPKRWFVYLPPRDRLTYHRLKKLPAVSDRVVNIHRVIDKSRKSRTKFEVLVPYSLIGRGRETFNQFHKELLWHLEKDNDPLLRKKTDYNPAPESELVRPGETLLKPGLAGFHVYQIDLSNLKNITPQNYLKRALQHALVRYTTKHLLHLNKQFRGGIVNHAGNHMYWLPSNHDPSGASLFLPHEKYGIYPELALARLRVLMKSDERFQRGIKGFAPEPTHLPSNTIPTFNTFHIQFAPHLDIHQRTRLLLALSNRLKHIDAADIIESMKGIPKSEVATAVKFIKGEITDEQAFKMLTIYRSRKKPKRRDSAD